MSEETNDDARGSVEVRISNKSVYNAVRNILINELGFSQESIRQDIAARVDLATKKAVDELLQRHKYGIDGIEQRIRNHLEYTLKEGTWKQLVKEVVSERANKEISNCLDDAIEAVVKDGIKLRFGWKRNVQIKVEKGEQ